MNSLQDKWKARRTEYRLYAKIVAYITKQNYKREDIYLTILATL